MSEARIAGKVKFFDRGKGYGFVELETGGDAFLHASAFEAAGLDLPGEGDAVSGRIESGPRGAQMVDVQRPQRSAPAQAAAGREGTPALGTVKWFDPGKGFGFVAVDDGGADAILHRATLDRSRLPALPEGQRVLVLVSESAKGREVVTLATLDAPAAPQLRPPRTHEVKRPFGGGRRPDEWRQPRRPAQRPRPRGRDLPDDVGE